MSGTYKNYISQIQENLKYRPTWLPGAPISLGAVGIFDDGVFLQRTTLDQLGMPFATSTDEIQDSISYSTKGAVSFTFKSAGETNEMFEAVAEASAGALVNFSKPNSIVLQLGDVTHNRIQNIHDVSKSILRSIQFGGEDSWQRDWVVISEVVDAGTATIAIADSTSSKLELRVSGSVAPSDLISASGSIDIAKEVNVETKVIASSGLTPLFRGLRVKRKWLGLFDEVQPASAVDEVEDILGEAVLQED